MINRSGGSVCFGYWHRLQKTSEWFQNLSSLSCSVKWHKKFIFLYISADNNNT